jgi:acetoacetate decarboxylase
VQGCVSWTAYSRLALRDKAVTDVQAIVELASAELMHARAVCAELKLPLANIHAPTLESLTDAITRLLKP